MSRIPYQVAFGQFFTPEPIAQFMVGLLGVGSDAEILEPASGEGVFLDALQQAGFQNLSAYEIDKRIIRHEWVKNESFVSSRLPENHFDAIIGNPPYIRWKNLNPTAKTELANSTLWQLYFNSLCDYLYIFILKSILLLKEGGELVFICPDYWLSTKYARNLRHFMLENGGFEKIIRFHESPIFEKVNSSVMIFHYRKRCWSKRIKIWQFEGRNKVTAEALVNLDNSLNIKKFLIPQFTQADNWLLADETVSNSIAILEQVCTSVHGLSDKTTYTTVGDICDIGNGMVSGLDKAFQITLKNNIHTSDEYVSSIQVAKAKHLKPYHIIQTTDYIFVRDNCTETEFAERFPNFYQKLQPYREQLDKRYSYSKELPYWKWAFLRNYNLFGRIEPRIFVPCKERITNKNHFRFALADAGIYPTQDVTALFKKRHIRESLEYITAYLNQPAVFNWLKYKGVVKGGIVEFSEKPLASIPFRLIDWNNPKECYVHEQI
ncbi:MAG: Eco57I restriction-modification methylase domain-containing protein, partial [Conchiformibius sp.]|nr:Eco57I restriction-modification methylase domain-containing protein [Conchiformibius sp.]